MTVRAIANLVETTLATPVMADIFKISRRLRSPIVHVAIAALHKIRSAEFAIVAVNRDSSSTGSVAACGIKRIPSSLFILRRLPIGLLRRLRVMRNALLDWRRVSFKRRSAGRVLHARIRS
jgi:hypothetical protein